MERVARGKRSGTLGTLGKTIKQAQKKHREQTKIKHPPPPQPSV